MTVPMIERRIFFFQAEDGIRDADVTGSSDVCSSDLILLHWTFPLHILLPLHHIVHHLPHFQSRNWWHFLHLRLVKSSFHPRKSPNSHCQNHWSRSEERRVGKECR